MPYFAQKIAMIIHPFFPMIFLIIGYLASCWSNKIPILLRPKPNISNISRCSDPSESIALLLSSIKQIKQILGAQKLYTYSVLGGRTRAPPDPPIYVGGLRPPTPPLKVGPWPP